MGRAALVATLTGLALCGCTKKAKVPPGKAPAPAPSRAQPRPPAGAAPDLPIPKPDARGRFTTINSGIGAQEALWHVRGALNVAALSCRGNAALAAGYNRFLSRHKAALAGAYAAEARAAPPRELDRHMTRLYNYFAQMPAQQGFCRVAAREVEGLGALASSALVDAAPAALERIEAPILAFYRHYEAYRVDLAAWRTNPSSARIGLRASSDDAAAPALQPAAQAGEPWTIQIGAFTGRDAADAAWARAKTQAPGLAAYRPHFEPAPGRPGLVRVQVGTAADRDAALRLCAAAAAGGFDCIPMLRGKS